MPGQLMGGLFGGGGGKGGGGAQQVGGPGPGMTEAPGGGYQPAATSSGVDWQGMFGGTQQGGRQQQQGSGGGGQSMPWPNAGGGFQGFQGSSPFSPGTQNRFAYNPAQMMMPILSLLMSLRGNMAATGGSQPSSFWGPGSVGGMMNAIQ